MTELPNKSPAPPTPGKIIARVAAGAGLTIAAGHASASLDNLATWFLAGFGAALALALSQVKEVSTFVPISCLASTLHFFIAASVACVIQRYVAMCVKCGASAAKDGRELSEKMKFMDVGEFIAQMKSGMPRLLRPFVGGLLDAVAKGDFAAGGRLFIRLTLLQGFLAMVEIVLLLVALARIL